MNYWLMKSEPDVFSYDDLVKKGKEHWDGVRNYTARNNMRAMKKGDVLLYYHSNEGKEIVGLAKVVREAYPDPTSDEDWSVVDVAPVKRLARPVGLAELKAHPALKEMAVVKRSRISVTPVTDEELKLVLRVSGTKL